MPITPTTPLPQAAQVARRPWRASAIAAALATAVAGCGGGGGGGTGAACDLAAQKADLRSYMLANYYFYATMPNPDAAASATLEDYLAAQMVARDRWSNIASTASFDALFSAGQSLGYGLFVAGQADDPLPLRIRYVSPGSPAALAGLARGMVIDDLGGQDPAVLKANGDFSLLSPSAEGQTLALKVRTSASAPAGSASNVSLSATTHALTPVAAPLVHTTPGGSKVGYLYHMSFIGTAATPLRAAINSLRSQGVTDLVLDLRYNQGGLIDASRELASLIGPTSLVSAPARTYATLSYSDQQSASNRSLGFNAGTTVPLGMSRVYVLAGPRTCSAAELVINGLKPFVDVVQIGSTTCGKPFGFNPVDRCSNTWSIVNFTATNALGQGDYESGIAPSCVVADDFDHALGDPAEALTAQALAQVDGASCPGAGAAATVSGARRAQGLTGSTRRPAPVRDGDAPGSDRMF
ncbi:MAG: hypothetical protein RL722_2994 [Pseudomonadota bacterium]